jgi:hypothetical protein
MNGRRSSFSFLEPARVKYLLGLARGLTLQHYARLERPARDTHSSLLHLFSNYGPEHKHYNAQKFYNIGFPGLFLKNNNEDFFRRPYCFNFHSQKFWQVSML